MAISKEEVLQVAKLSRLNFSEKELNEMQEHMSSVLEYMEVLNKVDTSLVPDLSRNLGEMRKGDASEGSLSHEDVLKNAPKTDGAGFIVPKVVE